MKHVGLSDVGLIRRKFFRYAMLIDLTRQVIHSMIEKIRLIIQKIGGIIMGMNSQCVQNMPNIANTAEDTGISQQVLKEMLHFAEKYEISRLILFGSRARGDYYRTSDIDLAISGGDIHRFSLSVDEETSTLLKFDFVNLDRAVQPKLQESIEREGIILYEKV